MTPSKRRVKSGLIWSAIDSFINQAISLVIMLVLASLLGPSDYGLVAMLAIFIAIAAVFVNSGFSSALIRKEDRDEKDYATTFFFSLAVSVVCYSILFFFAPVIADFYQHQELIDLTRIIALTVVMNAFAIIPRTKLTVELNFKSQAKANLTSLLCGGIIGLTMAFHGFGVWSLVAKQIISTFINVVMLNVLSPWKPTESFCTNTFKNLFGFGSKLLASNLLDTIYNNLYGLVIGKQFSATQLGFYNQANTLSSLPATTVTNVIQKVTYPMLSAMQGNGSKLDDAYLKTLKITTIVVFPLMFGLSIVSEPLVILLLGDKWNESAHLISILSMAFALYPVHAINLNMLQVKGRSDLFLKLEIIKKIIVTVVLFVTVPFGVVEMCVGIVVTSYISLFINTYYTAQLSSISQIMQFKALAPIGLSTAISAGFSYYLCSSISIHWLAILCMLITALLSYTILMVTFQKTLISEIRTLISREK